MYGKLLDRNRKLVEDRFGDMLKAQRHAVDRIVQRYRRLGAVLLDSDVGDDELRARLLSIVPEEQLREDQSDLASWTRGDRKARFEQTAERHAGLSQFAAPFLSRMKFVDEQGRGSVADAVGATGLPRTSRGGGAAACRPMCRSTSPHRPTGAAATHPSQRRDGPSPLGERVVPQGPRRDPDRQPRHRGREELRPVRGPSSCPPRSGSRSATRSGRAPDSLSIPTRPSVA